MTPVEQEAYARGKRDGAQEIVQTILDDVTFLGLHPEEDGCVLCDLRKRVRGLIG